MKKQISLKSILFAFTILSLSACATNPPDDAFTAEELAPNTMLSTTAEINSIDTQMATLDTQIESAKTRLSMYQTQTPAVNQSLISGTEAEISHYQVLKSNLQSRKQELNTQSTVK